MRKLLVAGAATAVLLAFALPGQATLLSGSVPKKASGGDPFAGCNTDAGQFAGATVFGGTEVEPWVDVNPTNTDNIVATWQQDRWSDGGSRGLVSACSGSPTWIRASDPWLSFAPNGVLYHISLSTTGGITNRFPDSAILVSRSTDGGKTWSDPTTLKQDAGPNILNDKESITADPNSSSFVYGVWDRLLNAGGSPSTESFENAIGFRGPAWFSRTTNGGTSWEPARIIFDPGQENQTIGNQIVVSPDGTLFDFFDLIQNFGSPSGRTFNVDFIKSTDHGATWSGAVRVDKINRVQVRDPDTGQRVRTEDFAPEVAVDPSNGNLYAVWQDSRFSGGTRADAAFSMSTNGGASWSPTIKVNANSAGTAAFNPSVHVLADGTVGLGFYDFRNNTSA